MCNVESLQEVEVICSMETNTGVPGHHKMRFVVPGSMVPEAILASVLHSVLCGWMRQEGGEA